VPAGVHSTFAGRRNRPRSVRNGQGVDIRSEGRVFRTSRSQKDGFHAGIGNGRQRVGQKCGELSSNIRLGIALAVAEFGHPVKVAAEGGNAPSSAATYRSASRQTSSLLRVTIIIL
jgi:hypothetical protein